MPAFRIPLRVVFYQDEVGDWIARCLEFDLVGDGETKEDALRCLLESIRLQVEASVTHDNPRNLFQPADGEYFRMFAQGKDVAIGKFEVNIPNVDIQGTESREYPGELVTA